MKTNFRNRISRLLQWLILVTIFIFLIDPLIASIFNNKFILLLDYEPFRLFGVIIALALYPNFSIGVTMYYIIFCLLFIGMIGFMFKLPKVILFVRRLLLPFWLLLGSYYATAISGSLYRVERVGGLFRDGDEFHKVIPVVEWRGFPFQFLSYDCAMTDPCVHIEYIVADMVLYFIAFWVIIQVCRYISRYRNAG